MSRKDYYRRLFRVYLGYRRKRTRLDYLPVRLWVETTSVCNLRCVMCPNKELKKEEKGFMDFPLFRKVIDEARRYVFDVNLIHRGEGLLHPEFPRMVAYSHEAGVNTKFHTNATLLDEARSRALIAAGLDQISFSFDGYDRKTYENIRVNADFEKTLANVVRFLEIKRELRSKRPYAVLELINFPDAAKVADPGGRRAFLDRFRGLPLDRVEVKEMHNWAGEIPAEKSRKKYVPCTFLWQALIIFWDGSVLPCTQDFHGYLKLGNVRGTSLEEIWNGDRLVRLREKILRGDIADLETCSQCDRLWRDQILGVPKEYLLKFLLKRMP
ncbi:MAG: radical SAM protein [Candidatus Aminicenantes bacterium RBG_16_63_16]|nr:MAG: radical SAM protein [Candidatus Aminicenantes bacterium RBG_16_63_16]